MNTERFNEVYKQFINSLTKRFDIDTKNDLLESNIKNNINHYIDLFVINLLPYIDEISACNIDYFRYLGDNIMLSDEISFKEVIDKLYKDKQVIDSFHKICTYIMTLYLILLKTENDIETYVNEHHRDNDLYSQMISVINERESIISNWKENNKDKQNEAIQKQKDEEIKKNKSSSEIKDNKSNSNRNVSKSKNNTNTNMPNMGFPFGDIQNTQIGKLATELAEQLENDDNLQMPNITNPSDIFSMMFSGGDNNPLGNIMTKVCSELDTKIKSGEVDQSALFSEAQGLMGNNNLFNADNMQMPNNTNSSDTNKNTNQKKKKKKIKRKKLIKVKKNKSNVDTESEPTKEDKILEETLNEVINE